MSETIKHSAESLMDHLLDSNDGLSHTILEIGHFSRLINVIEHTVHTVLGPCIRVSHPISYCCTNQLVLVLTSVFSTFQKTNEMRFLTPVETRVETLDSPKSRLITNVTPVETCFQTWWG